MSILVRTVSIALGVSALSACSLSQITGGFGAKKNAAHGGTGGAAANDSSSDPNAAAVRAGLSPKDAEQGRVIINGWDGLADQPSTQSDWTIQDKALDAQPTTPGTASTGGTTTTTGGSASYSADVAPLLQSCVTCHTAGGQRASSPMDSYANAKIYASSIAARVAAGTMPPGGPASSVQAKFAQVMAAWQSAGYPESASAGATATGTSLTDDVTFHIKAGTGQGAWNDSGTEAVAHVGKKFTIVNDDSVTHQWHTNGSPCPHGNPIPPGGSATCTARQKFSDGPLYDHISEGKFYIRAE